MRALKICTVVLARFFLSAIFLASGMNKIFHWQEQETNLMNILSEWQSNVGFSEELQNGFAFLVPWAPVLLALATLFEFIGGLLVLLGSREKLGATLLILCLVPTMLIAHQFWFIDSSLREMQIALFLKDLAILGGLFLVLLHGAQSSSASSSSTFPAIKLG